MTAESHTIVCGTAEAHVCLVMEQRAHQSALAEIARLHMIAAKQNGLLHALFGWVDGAYSDNDLLEAVSHYREA